MKGIDEVAQLHCNLKSEVNSQVMAKNTANTDPINTLKDGESLCQVKEMYRKIWEIVEKFCHWSNDSYLLMLWTYSQKKHV